MSLVSIAPVIIGVVLFWGVVEAVLALMAWRARRQPKGRELPKL